MSRVLAILSLVNIFMSLAVSTDINDNDPTCTRKNDDIVFRVVNGIPAKIGEIPYQVSLKTPIRKNNYMSFCGGSVIAENKVMSAAHCVTTDGNTCDRLLRKYKMKSLMKLYVVAGTLRNRAKYQDDKDGTEQWRRMKSAHVPRGYWFPKNDICIIFTVAPFVFNQYVKPLPLASRDMEYGSMECLASGWGKIGKKDKASDILLYAKLRLIPSSACSRIHRQRMGKFICTDSYVTDVLQGDSGGPLVCRGTGDGNDINNEGVIVGVVSGARRQRWSKTYDSFFTRVSSHRRFMSGNEATITTSVLYIVLLSQIIPVEL
ncbi:chymotrypsin-1-like [Cydia fagiglandana]|uniref:chymotrypsin-1-like n=1 Tax=Cydia fagiglandana TaxID=1458189 RepID=UPI002FEE1B8D